MKDVCLKSAATAVLLRASTAVALADDTHNLCSQPMPPSVHVSQTLPLFQSTADKETP